MLKNLISTLNSGFETLCNGSSTLKIFPDSDFDAFVKSKDNSFPGSSIRSSADLCSYSPKNDVVQERNVSSSKETPSWKQDSFNLAEDWRQIGMDLRYVMNRFALENGLSVGK